MWMTLHERQIGVASAVKCLVGLIVVESIVCIYAFNTPHLQRERERERLLVGWLVG